MSAIAITVPTVGRPELANLLSALALQVTNDDRVIVVCDRPLRHNWCTLVVEGLRRAGAPGRWVVWPRDNLGHFGHVARNEALDFLAGLEHRPDWVWSIDDDDMVLPGALDAIRVAAASEEGPWYIARMVGGVSSHFDGVTIPNQGERILLGNVGTPMLLFPASVQARFGLGVLEQFGKEWEAGYFGDLEMAVDLREELGDPVWIEHTIAEIRPSALVPARLAQ